MYICKKKYTMVNFSFSEEQENIFKYAQTGVNNIIVQAVAGAGKTTTLVECVNRILQHDPNKQIMLLAHNKSTKDTLLERIGKDKPNVRVYTLHGLSWRMFSEHFGFKPEINDDKYRNYINKNIDKIGSELYRNLSNPKKMAYKSNLFNLVDKARHNLKQNELSEMLGISNNYLSNIENGHSIPSLEIFSDICVKLKITPDLLLLGVIIILFALAYSAGPFPLSYHGLGEVTVFIFFGIVPVTATYWLQTSEVNMSVVIGAAVMGLLSSNILLVNNYRDYETDKIDGKRTSVVILGRKFAIVTYLVNGLLATIMLCTSYVGVVFSVLFLFLHIKTWIGLRKCEGTALNAYIGLTARNQLLYTIIYVIVVAIQAII